MPKEWRAGLARAVIGGWLAAGAAGLAGCALLGGTEPGEPGDDGWAGYFRGDDLRPLCDADQPDHLRLIYRPAGGLFQALEVMANPAGGALVVHQAVAPADLAVGEPTPDWRDRGHALILSPRDFGAVIYWLDRLGLLTPDLTPPPAGDLVWLLSGCLNGAWLLNIHVPPDATGEPGLTVSDRPSDGRPPEPPGENRRS